MTDKNGARQVRDYLIYVDAEVRKRFDAGMTPDETAFDIALGDFANWLDFERIAVNVDTLYKEYRGETSPPDIQRLFTLMAKLKQARRTPT